jgi:flavin-dependent dehydrogenase
VSGDRFDAVVVGASTAGCTAARLLALRGARVALLERRPAMDAHKTVCTHYIQASAAPTIRKLGLAPLIEERGAVANTIDLWTRYSGWIGVSDDAARGYSVTRRTLDPLLRELTAQTPGVEFLPGHTVDALTGNGRPSGVEAQDRSGARRRLHAKVVIAADGRGSRLARLAGVRGRVKPNNRFFYWAYWTGLQPAGDRARMWFPEPDAAYTFPNEDGLSVVLVAPHRDRLPEFRSDLEGAYHRFYDGLPDAPDFSGATRESKIIGKLELPNVSRPAARPGLAFAGDAALASDPLWGIGCGWAFQSADWLAEALAPALAGGGGEREVDAALEHYRRTHRRRLAPHHFMIADLSSGRQALPLERMMYRAAARDPAVRHAFEEVGTRRRSPAAMFGPRMLSRMVAAGR